MKAALAILLMLVSMEEVFAERISNILITNNQWPDVSTMERFSSDAIRLMNASTEEEKALAIFRFIRMFTTRTNGRVPSEPALGDTYIDDPLKVMNVYGAHHCDGLTRVMELAWRSRQGRAEKLYRSGHTQADVHWLDSDGFDRGHLFDVSEGWCVYDRTGRHIAGPDEIALDYSLIFRPSKGPIPRRPNYWGMWNWIHAPQLAPSRYDNRITLRKSERFTRLWGNMDSPYQNNFGAKGKKDFEHGPYTVTFGNGVLEYKPDLADPDLLEESVNLAVSFTDSSSPIVHPAAKRQHAEIIFKMALPYVISNAWIDGSFHRQHPEDKLSIALSTDEGKSWKEVWQPDRNGPVSVKKLPLASKFDLYQPIPRGGITPFGTYGYWVKVHMLAAEDPGSVGMDDLIITTITQHNIFSLPMLWPGTNRLTVVGEIPEDMALKVTLVWDDLEGEKNEHVAMIQQTPFSYPILTSGRRWQDVRAISLTTEAIPFKGNGNTVSGRQKEPKIFQEITAAQAFNTSTIVGNTYPLPLKPVSEYISDLKNPEKQVQALSGLMVYRDATSLNAIKDVAFQSISHPQKDMAVQALYLISQEQSLPILLQILGKSPLVKWKMDPNNKFVELGHWYNIAALVGLQMVDAGEQAAVPRLMAVLETILDNQDKAWQPHASIIRSLGKLGDPRAAKVIKPFLAGHPPDVVAAAARALGELGDVSSIPRLKQLFRDSTYPMVTKYSSEALHRLGVQTETITE